MPLVAGISFKKAGKVYYFDPAGIELVEGDLVIVETARGLEFGEVMIEPRDVPEHEIVPPLKQIIRKANESDMAREEANAQKEKNAYSVCLQKIQEHNLSMKLIDAEYCFDGSQVTFYFSSESRVDFRELVKDLAGVLRIKIQLHQVGVRDEAKLFGGIGPCGRALCCTTFLNNFEPVSMKMAKEQSLFLNPLKFSGTCGKLMCCLKYEYSMYRDVRLNMPPVGATVTTAKGTGRIVDVNVVKESLSIEFEDGAIQHYSADSLTSVDGSYSIGECCGSCGEQCESMRDKEQHGQVEAIDTHQNKNEQQSVSIPVEEPTASNEELANSNAGTNEKPRRRRRRPRRRGKGKSSAESNADVKPEDKQE